MSDRFAILRERIVEHPWQSLAVACLAGALIRLDRSGRARKLLVSTLGTAALRAIAETLVPSNDIVVP